jgi:hypothetical protein
MSKPTSVQVTAETHRELTTDILKSQLDTGKRISFDQLIRAALTVARRYPEELRALLAESK